MSASKDFCLTRQPFRDVPTEFENCFLCLLRISLCVVKWVDFQTVLCYTKGRKKQFAQSPAGFTIWRKSMRVSLPTTILTIYGFGLPGLHAAKSTRKQSIRTQKPRKARKITQKIRILAFGSKFKQIRILSFRPKNQPKMRPPHTFGWFSAYNLLLSTTSANFHDGRKTACVIVTARAAFLFLEGLSLTTQPPSDFRSFLSLRFSVAESKRRAM